MVIPMHGVGCAFLLSFFIIMPSQSVADSTEIAQLPLRYSEVAREAFYKDDLNAILDFFSKPEVAADTEAAYYSAMLLLRHEHALTSAFELLSSAADGGHQGAMFQLGQMYESGVFLDKDMILALDWYHKSQLHSLYPPQLDALFIEGLKDSSPLHEAKLIKSITDKANANDSLAQFQLGFLYERGQWLEANSAVAVDWYTKASENGNDQASLNMGLFHCRGMYVEKSIDKADYFFAKTNRNIACK